MVNMRPWYGRHRGSIPRGSTNSSCGYDETGRLAGMRGLCRKACGFESHYPHHAWVAQLVGGAVLRKRTVWVRIPPQAPCSTRPTGRVAGFKTRMLWVRVPRGAPRVHKPFTCGCDEIGRLAALRMRCLTGVLVRVQSSAPMSRLDSVIFVCETNDLGSTPSGSTLWAWSRWLVMPLFASLLIDHARIVKWYNGALIRLYWKFDSSYAHRDLAYAARGRRGVEAGFESPSPRFESRRRRCPPRDGNTSQVSTTCTLNRKQSGTVGAF